MRNFEHAVDDEAPSKKSPLAKCKFYMINFQFKVAFYIKLPGNDTYQYLSYKYFIKKKELKVRRMFLCSERIVYLKISGMSLVLNKIVFLKVY